MQIVFHVYNKLLKKGHNPFNCTDFTIYVMSDEELLKNA